MHLIRPLSLFVALALLPAPLVCAKGKPKPKAPAPAPAPVVPAAPPLPSEMLQAFSSNNLDHLLGPLNNGALPRAEIMRMQTEFTARLAAGPAEEKGMLQAAINLCVVFGRIMDERERAVLSMQHGSRPMTSGTLGLNQTVRLNDWHDDLQAHREQQDVKAHKEQARASDAFIASAATNAADTAWRQRMQPWRNQVQQLLTAERQAELTALAPTVPPPVAAVAPAPNPAPPAAAPVADAPAADPVLGSWMLEGRSPLELNADYTISGDRHGHWAATKANDGKHHYELYWNPPKNWTDRLVLSEDGGTMTGTTRDGKPIAFNRP